MRKPFVALILIVLAGCLVPETHAAQPTQEHDGSWLINGIRLYERVRDRAPNLTQDEGVQAVAVAAYIRGVLDVQYSLVLRAAAVYPNGLELGSVTDPKSPKAPAYRAMFQTKVLMVPLFAGGYLAQTDTPDQQIQMIKNYLEKHPEAWSKQAVGLIEDALVESYSPKPAASGPPSAPK